MCPNPRKGSLSLPSPSLSCHVIPFGLSALLLPGRVLFSFLSFPSYLCSSVLRAIPPQPLNFQVLGSSPDMEDSYLFLNPDSYSSERESGCPTLEHMLSPDRHQWSVPGRDNKVLVRENWYGCHPCGVDHHRRGKSTISRLLKALPQWGHYMAFC